MDACRDIDNCEADDNRDFMIIRFYESDTTSLISKNVNFSFLAEGAQTLISMDSVDKVFDVDTTIYDIFLEAGDTLRIPEGNAVGLPLNAAADAIIYYCVLPNLQISDTLQLSYFKEYSVFDPECSPSLTYVNIDTISQTFDSLAIVGRVTNRQLTTNIEIYL